MAGQRKKTSRNMVGTQVRRLRSAAKLTQEELAARCFVLGFEISGGDLSHI